MVVNGTNRSTPNTQCGAVKLLFLSLKLRCESLFIYTLYNAEFLAIKRTIIIRFKCVHHYAHYPFSNFQQQCNVGSVSHFCPSFLFIPSYFKHSIISFRNFLSCVPFQLGYSVFFFSYFLRCKRFRIAWLFLFLSVFACVVCMSFGWTILLFFCSLPWLCLIK